MVSNYSLDGLSTELLIKIFGFLDICDLCRLRQTCTRLNNVISTWSHIFLKSSSLLVTNQKSDIFLTRCSSKLSTIEKYRISNNWHVGRYEENSLLYVRNKYIPWLYLDDKVVWLSRGRKISCYERKCINVVKPKAIVYGESKADVANFQLKNHFMVSGQRDGSIWMKNIREGKDIFDFKFCHYSDINSIDINEDGTILLSGSRDNSFKIWKIDTESDNILEEIHSEILEDIVWKVSLLKEKSMFAIGTSGNYSVNSLLIYDIERITNPIGFPSTARGGGVLDVRWDGPNTLWSCGYDTYLKRWDIRTGKCEQIYEDSHGSALYCLDYDYHNTIMTGTQTNGRVILWDTRQKKCVQLFFMDSCKQRRNLRSSPIYSLSFDSEYLFTATDQNLNVLDFSVYDGKVNDYSFFC